MGLDFSHCDARWSYSGFGRFRTKLVQSLGIFVDVSAYDNGVYRQAKFSGIWPLINHSDCDGKLTIREMKKIVPALKSILENWNPDDYDTESGKELLCGMEEAISKKQQLKFQ